MTKQEKINSCREELECLNAQLFLLVHSRKTTEYVYNNRLFSDDYSASEILEYLHRDTRCIERIQKAIIHWNEKLVDAYEEIE